MSARSLQRGVRIVGAVVAAAYGQYALAASLLNYEFQRIKADSRRRNAIQAFNDAQVDRLEMVERNPRQARTRAYGRVRSVEGVRRPPIQTGPNDENLTLFVSLAGHEIDGIEGWYLEGQRVALDGSGWVKRVSYGNGSGYKTNTAGYARGATSIVLTTGTGTVLAGDGLVFDGDSTVYTVATGITAPGTVVLAAPGLLKPLPASAVNATLAKAPYLVTTASPRTAVRVGDGDVTLDAGYLSGTALATYTVGSGESTMQGTASVSVLGSTATVSGAPSGSDVTVFYQVGQDTSHVRIRPYLGTTTQNVGADLAAEYPGKISATDRGAGIAMAVMDCVFSTDVFPQGRPTLTALFRGAKLYDPRKDSTVAGGSGAHRLADPTTWEWTQNPALIAYDYARWKYGWNVPASRIVTADVMAAADACDVSTVFTLRHADASTTTVTLPRYRADMVIATNADPLQSMEAITDAMNGRVFWSGGMVRMRAGALASAVLDIDKSWLVETVSASGVPDRQPVIMAAQSVPRARRWNRVAGSCIDPDQRFQMLPYPAVEDAVLVAAKGERETDLSLPAVSHIAHAQHLASMTIRAAQAGQRIEMRLGLKALRLELMDVFTLTLNDRHGITAKTYECIGWQWAPDGVIRVQGQEISAALFTVDAELKGKDPAPDSNLREAWEVEQLTGLAVTSGAAAVLDTSILTRTVVSWDAAVSDSIRQGGDVEIRYREATGAAPADEWMVWTERGNVTETVIPGLLTGRFYLFEARFVQRLPLVHGPMSTPVVRHQIAARRSTKIFRQTTAPTGDVIDGDEWFDTDDGNAYYVRVSGTWTATPTGTGGLESGAASVVATADQGVGSQTVFLTATDILTTTLDCKGFPLLLSATVTAEGSLSARDVTFELVWDGSTQLSRTFTPVGDSNQPGNPWGMYGTLLQFVVASPGTGTKTAKLVATGSHASNAVTVSKCNLYCEAKKR